MNPLDARLRFREWLVDHELEPEVAYAILDSMPPLDWSEVPRRDELNHQFATVDQQFERIDQQFERIDQRFEAVDQRFEAVDRRLDRIDARLDRVDHRLDALTGRVDGLSERMDTLSERMDGFGERMDAVIHQMADLGRTVTMTAATMAVMLAVFMIGTIASLIASGAYN